MFYCFVGVDFGVWLIWVFVWVDEVGNVGVRVLGFILDFLDFDLFLLGLVVLLCLLWLGGFGGDFCL